MRNVRFLQGLLAALVVAFAGSAAATFHEWRVNEIFSNADGSVQFVEFHEISGSNGENLLAGHQLNVSNGMQTHSFTFGDNLPSAGTADRYFLVATQGFANLGIVQPDYIVPAGFLFVGGGTIQYGATAASGPYGAGTGPVDVVAYQALPSDGRTSVDRSMNAQVNSPTNFAGVTGSVGAAAASPQTGWWWNPLESGRGFFIEQQGNDLFFAAYLYANDGRALWTISAGPMSSPSSYQGALATFAGGQTLTGPYVAATLGPSLGAVTLAFSDATHGTLTWPGGVVPIQRFDYAGLGGPIVAGAPQTGWWWNAAESGRGFSIEVQGGTLFIAGYMYDAAGNPIWLLSVGTVNAGTYQANWTQYANGQTITGPYQLPTVVNANAGALALQFTDATHGTLTLPDGRMIPLTRFAF